MREIEAKFCVRSLADIEMRLQDLAAHMIQPRTLEVNYRFDTPQAELARQGRVLRLRQDAGVHFTYKDQGEVRDGFQSRREIEFTADDFNAGRAFLEALGYEVVFIYEKFRTIYELQSAHIMLDELGIGTFLEIEAAEADLKPAAARLGLRWEKAIAGSYHALFERARQSRALDCRDLTFENFKGQPIQPPDMNIEFAD
jgi:adenylate cyclase, class 2